MKSECSEHREGCSRIGNEMSRRGKICGSVCRSDNVNAKTKAVPDLPEDCRLLESHFAHYAHFCAPDAHAYCILELAAG